MCGAVLHAVYGGAISAISPLLWKVLMKRSRAVYQSLSIFMLTGFGVFSDQYSCCAF